MNYILKDKVYNKRKIGAEIAYNFFVALLVTFSLVFIAFSVTYIADVPVLGISMQPTLNPKGETKSDIVYINRFANYTYGDIIVIKQDQLEHEYIIKRVIGLQNDTINIISNSYTGEVELYVNDILLHEDYIYDITTSTDPNNLGMEATLSNFIHLKATKPELFNANGYLVVPENQVFVLGDNRGVSLDSSMQGPYSTSSVVGRVDFVIPYGESTLTYFLNYFTPFHFN